MTLSPETQQRLRALPAVDRLLALTQAQAEFDHVPASVVVQAIRDAIDAVRQAILAPRAQIDDAQLSDAAILKRIKANVDQAMALNLKRTINATGIVIHTNLGRSVLADRALEHLATIAGRYSNLEFDLAAGKRGSRYAAVEELICDITGAEAALAVNNNAGAVLLGIETLAKGREVIISRGELVEIGGSFRIPDVMAKSGAILREVGTTNRTHYRDYEQAIVPETALLLKAHTSNYDVVGFTATVDLKQLVELGREHALPVMEDLGSGTFIDLAAYGLSPEPTVQDSVKTGADVITFSGDKLLGGPQAGIIVGQKTVIDQIKQNPLTRALRIDKMTLAALESTLRLYRDEREATQNIPTLRMLLMPFEEISARAQRLLNQLTAIQNQRLEAHVFDRPSKAGGGALPLLDIPSKCVGIKITGQSPNGIEKALRRQTPPVIGRIEDDIFLMDLRTVLDDEIPALGRAIEILLEAST